MATALPETSGDSDLEVIDRWSRDLGLLAVPLRQPSVRAAPFVLLDGVNGGLCIGPAERLGEQTRSEAWSANVGPYVGIDLSEQCVKVQRWQRREHPEVHKLEEVVQNLDGFYDYLRIESPPPDMTVVPHVLRASRQVRALLGARGSGTTALGVFLALLGRAVASIDPAHAWSPADWNLDEELDARLTDLDPAHQSALLETLLQGPVGTQLRLDADVLLRHAAGPLFQEAHYELVAQSADQLTIPGILLPGPRRTKPSPLRLGLHFTPPTLVRAIVERALEALEPADMQSITVFDPACGSGEFLREALRAIRRRGISVPVRLIGWDISKAACMMAQFALSASRRDDPGDMDVSILHVDALGGEEWPGGAQLIMMNPPFVALPDQTPEQQSQVQSILGSLVRQRPDVAAAFWWKAIQTVAPGGVVGTILPAALLDGSSVEGLRGSIAEVADPCLVARLGSQDLFAAARVDAGLYIGQRPRSGRPSRGEPPIAVWVDHRQSSYVDALRSLRRFDRATGQVDRSGYSIYLDENLGRSSTSWAPRPYHARLLTGTLQALPRVGDLFDVRQGALTGKNETFLLPVEDWEGLPKRERTFFRPAVVNASIVDGKLEKSYYVFYPHEKEPLLSEADLRRRLPRYYRQWLEPSKAALKQRRRHESHWWELSEHRAWQRPREPKIVTAYFGDSGSFTYDQGGEFVVVQGYAWLWRPPQSSGSDPARCPAVAYVALLNSALFAVLLAAHANHVGGGQWNLSKRFVAGIPIPNLGSADTPADVIEALGRIGRVMLDGGDWCSRSISAQLEDLTMAAYGIPATGHVAESLRTHFSSAS